VIKSISWDGQLAFEIGMYLGAAEASQIEISWSHRYITHLAGNGVHIIRDLSRSSDLLVH